MLSTQFNRDNQHQTTSKPSLLAACIALALLPSAAFAAPATEETVIVEGSATTPVDDENDYSVTSTSAGTKMQMTQRDIPQSVTIVSQQRMEDQQLQTLGEVMENTLGISKSQADSDRALYYSRGFQIDNYMVDGIPTYFESRWNLGDALSDMALFERVEVVRGATGLMTGTGNPSAAINMVRKHATSREFKGDVSAEYGSWNKERYVADLQSPLTEDGKIRARIVGGTGWNSGKRKVDALDLFADGSYELFGRQHNLMFGGSYSKQNNRYFSSWANIFPDEIGSFYNFNGNFPQTDWSPQNLAQDDTTHMKSLYAATRVTLADPLHLILGARYTNWRVDTLTYSMEKNHTTPYAGLVFDINDNWSTYASYTSIFQPQNDRDSSGKYLAPITGNNYELGLKSDWMNSRLTTTLAIFRIEQDNVAQSTGTPIPGSNGETAYKAVDGTVSKGVEFELNGAITDNWQLTFGATRYIAEDNEGNAVNPNLPRTTVKMFTSYRLPVMAELTVGGGVNWQNRVYTDTVTPYGTFRAEQGSYALVDLFTRYQVTKNFSLQGNVNNLFDKTYDTNVEGSIVYGAPRNFSITGTYQF